MCTWGYVYVWIMELLQHVMALLDNYNTSGVRGFQKEVCLSVCSVSSVVGEEFDVFHFSRHYAT